MNFRQRLAWLTLFVYLGLSCAFVYYIFEISDAYNTLALDHTGKDHTRTSWFSMWEHLADIPFPVWLFILFLPYLQVFCLIFAFTRSTPMHFCIFSLLAKCTTSNCLKATSVKAKTSSVQVHADTTAGTGDSDYIVIQNT